MPLNHLTERATELPTDRALLVHCAGGYRSSIAASLLQQRGFGGVSELAGGVAAWEAAGLPLVVDHALRRLVRGARSCAEPPARGTGTSLAARASAERRDHHGDQLGGVVGQALCPPRLRLADQLRSA